MSIIYHKKWLRRNKYRLREHENGLYISLKHSASFETYNPFEVDADILLEFLRIGRAAARGEDATDAILAFVSAYGMLGFAQSVIAVEYADGDVKLHRNNFVSPKRALTLDEYFDLFMPSLDSNLRYRKNKLKGMTLTMRMAEVHEDEVWLCMNNHDYAEDLQWISDFAQHLYVLLANVQRGAPFQYALGNVRTTLSSDGGAVRTEYAFDSLKSALDIMLVRELTATRWTLKLCKHCGGVFRRDSLRAEYCSASCRNVRNVKLSRQRRG